MFQPLVLFFTLLALSQNLSAQNRETDSLRQIIRTTKDDSLKTRTLNKLAFGQVFQDRDLARKWLDQSEQISKGKTRCRYSYVEMLNYRGALMDVSGHRDSALFFMNRGLKLARRYQFPNLEVRLINNLGMVNWTSGNFQEALRYFFEALKSNESLPEDQQMKFDTSYSNIGLVYQELGMEEKALPFHEKAYAIRKAKGMQREQAISLNNMGICYNAIGQVPRAIEIYKQGLVLAKAEGDDLDYCKITENLGNSYQYLKRYPEAIRCYKTVLDYPVSARIRVSVLGGLVAAYNKLGQPKVAVAYGEAGIREVESNPDSEAFSKHLYQYTAQSYYMMGQIGKGEAYYAKFIEITEKVFSQENAAHLASYEIKYETAKKEKELAEKRALLLESEAAAKQRTNVLIGISALVVFLVLTGLLLFRQQKFKHTQLEQEHQLKTAIAQIETQNKLHEQRLSISRDLHDNIGAQLTFIISAIENIKYAFKIENPKLDHKLENISSFTKGTILELRDTIWAMNSDEIHFEDLRARILNFLEKARDVTENVQFAFDIDPKLNDWKLSSIAGMNLYRTIQEAVNNAIKHAAATIIRIAVEEQDQKILIKIEDNGHGFDLVQTEAGNGMANMQKRIEDIGGVFTINSNAGLGTQISVSISKQQTVS